jgi:hypothetical protein
LSIADILRWDIIVEGFVLIGFACAVIQQAKKFRSPPAHVYLIAMSYSVLIGALILEIYGRLGNPWSWRIPAGQFAMKFGLMAMLVMYRHYSPDQRAKRHNAVSDKAAGDLLREADRRKRDT